MTTKVKSTNITLGSLSSDSVSTDSLPPTFSNVVPTDASWTPTGSPNLDPNGGYFIINGSGFGANANVLIGTTEVTSTVISDSQIEVTHSSLTANTQLDLSLYNYDGTNLYVKNGLTTNDYAGSPYGYFAAIPTNGSAVYRVDWASDTTPASTRGPLSAARRYLASTGNALYGWVVGGVSLSRIERIDYGNDSVTASIRSNLNIANGQGVGASGNANYGYVFGSSPITSAVQRIDYAADTTTASLRGPLAYSVIYTSASGNADYVWKIGGYPGALSTVSRVTISSDTSTASIRGPLSSGRGYLNSAGNSNYSYTFGGYPGGQSIIDRINYADDTSTALLRQTGLGPSIGYGTAATSTSNYGYFHGGSAGSTLLRRLDFSNDTTTSNQQTFTSAYDHTAVGGFAG